MFTFVKGVFVLSIIKLLTLILTPWKYLARLFGNIRNHGRLFGFIENLDLFFLHPSIDPDYQNNPNSCISVLIQTKGNLNVTEFLEQLDFILSSQPEFSRLKQHVKWFMGIGFWCWDPKFQLKDHVKIFSNFEAKALSPEHLSQLSVIPFLRNFSMWNMNIYKSCGIIYFRCHHSICDGQSLMELLENLKIKRSTYQTSISKVQTTSNPFLGIQKSIEKISSKVTSSNSKLCKPSYYSPNKEIGNGKIYFTLSTIELQCEVGDLLIVQTVLTALSLAIHEFLSSSDINKNNPLHAITVMKPYNLRESMQSKSFGNFYGVEFFKLELNSNMETVQHNVKTALRQCKLSRMNPSVTKILTDFSNNIPKFRSALFVLPHSKFTYPEIILTFMKSQRSVADAPENELFGGGTIDDISYWIPAYHNGIWCSVGIFNNQQNHNFGKLSISGQLSNTVVRNEDLAKNFQQLFEKHLQNAFENISV